MPEIAEIARIVHYLKKHVVSKTIAVVKTQEDDIVYGKVGTSASSFQKAMTGKKVVDAKQQGKYFWLEMESPPHPLMHFGMSGWMEFSNDPTSYYRTKKTDDVQWPPKFWKFILQMKEETDCEVAFTDARRLGRIRLVDVAADRMRLTTPLKENGPDPVIDSDILTVEWLTRKLRSKRVPVKALLLDQANISGVGNWVGDEVLYQARLHPEQYSNTFSDAQIKQLHEALTYVCKTAVDLLGESEKLPKDWLMHQRWGKGKKNGAKMPNGDKIIFLTVGGRTSAVVPSVQKKTGAVAGDVADEANKIKESDDEEKPKKGSNRKSKTVKSEHVVDKMSKPTVAQKRGRKRIETAVKMKEDEEEQSDGPVVKKQKVASRTTSHKTTNTGKLEAEPPKERRRSGRLSKA